MPDRIYLALIPFFALGIVIQVANPRRLLPCWCLAIPIGIVLLIAAVLMAIPARHRGSANAWGSPVVFAYLAASAFVNSVWPLAMLLPALILVIKWRAVAVQTGRRPPGD